MRRHPLAKCEECPLYEGGKYVASVGPEEASIAFVGETPSKYDARQARPFSGTSGELLNIITSHHGINKEDAFLANSVSCLPPGGGPAPTSAIVACRDRLLGELQEHNVETAVAFGNAAATSLLGVSGVTKLRVGPGRKSKYFPGVHVISTLNPAAALRQADLFPSIVADIGKVNHAVSNWVPPQYVVADDVDQAIGFLDELDRRGSGPVSVDIEVDIEKDTSFDHPTRYGMLCVGIGYAEGKVLVLSEGVMASEQVRDRLGRFLRGRKIIAQNGKFDLAGVYPIIGALELWFDTMLASYVFDERPGVHGLKYMAVEYLGAPQYDEEIKRYVGPGIGYGAIPRDLLYKYNAYDVACTYALWLLFEKRFSNPENEGLRRVHDFLVAASNELMYIELNGIAVDREYLNELTVKYLDVLEDIEKEIDEIIGFSINPRSPLQVKKYLREAGVVIPKMRDPKGIMKETTNEEALNLILEKQAEPESEVAAFIRTLLKHRKESKLYGTYVKGTRKRLYRGRVYPTFLLHGTTTGRLACRNPNLQNVPRGSSIRKLFVPAKPERVFIQTDYSQAELRVLSFLAKDIYFRDIFNAGDKDVFDDLTPLLYPELGPKESVSPAQWKETRIRVKAYVYGLAYGREAGSIATEYGIPFQRASQDMRKFFSVIPEIVDFRERTRKSVLDGEDLTTPWGRRRRFMLITQQNVKSVMNEALAFLPQSTASDMCLQAATWVRKETKGYGWIRNLVHDSILLECHKEDAEEIKTLMEKRMIESAETIVGDYVKFAVDSKIGQHWGEV